MLSTSYLALTDWLFQYDIHMINPTHLEDSFCHEIFVLMEGQGRGLPDYFSITIEYYIFAVYQFPKACRNWLRKVTNQYWLKQNVWKSAL